MVLVEVKLVGEVVGDFYKGLVVLLFFWWLVF